MSDKDKNLKEQLGEKPQEIQPQQQQFRGAAISIAENGQYGMQLVGGVKLLEVYGVLTLILEKLKKDLSA